MIWVEVILNSRQSLPEALGEELDICHPSSYVSCIQLLSKGNMDSVCVYWNLHNSFLCIIFNIVACKAKILVANFGISFSLMSLKIHILYLKQRLISLPLHYMDFVSSILTFYSFSLFIWFSSTHPLGIPLNITSSDRPFRGADVIWLAEYLPNMPNLSVWTLRTTDTK